jgi:hypothetical protein
MGLFFRQLSFPPSRSVINQQSNLPVDRSNQVTIDQEKSENFDASPIEHNDSAKIRSDKVLTPVSSSESIEAISSSKHDWTKPLLIGDVIIQRSDFKTYYSKLWKLESYAVQRESNYRHLRAKFIVIARLTRRYITYHKESQYLVQFINKKSQNLTIIDNLTEKRKEVIQIMDEYRRGFHQIQTIMFQLEKLIKFLKISNGTIKRGKFTDVMKELYKIESNLQNLCFRMNDLLRTSDHLIIHNSSLWEANHDSDDESRSTHCALI